MKRVKPLNNKVFDHIYPDFNQSEEYRILFIHTIRTIRSWIHIPGIHKINIRIGNVWPWYIIHVIAYPDSDKKINTVYRKICDNIDCYNQKCQDICRTLSTVDPDDFYIPYYVNLDLSDYYIMPSIQPEQKYCCGIPLNFYIKKKRHIKWYRKIQSRKAFAMLSLSQKLCKLKEVEL
jgi:hypothetical protein